MSDTQGSTALSRSEVIEGKFNMERASQIGVSLGGLDLKDMAQIVEYAKGMSLSDSMVPAFCRNKPWTCFALCIQAMNWKMAPYDVAKQAYEVENTRTKERTVAYMSQILHAVLENRGLLKERLSVEYEGEGDDMVCIVSGTFKGETKPRVWRSPRLADRRPKATKRRNHQTGEEYETTPGSPLWYSKPQVQLAHDTLRDWGRIYAPDAVLGIYSPEEMEDAGFVSVGGRTSDETREADESFTKRLSASALARAGFAPTDVISADHVEREVETAMAARDDPPVASAAQEQAAAEPVADGSPEAHETRQRRSRRAGAPAKPEEASGT